MRPATDSYVDSTWSRHARRANGVVDATLFGAPAGLDAGHGAGDGGVRSFDWLDVVARALHAVADVARARAAARRQRRRAQETLVALGALDDRTLRDLGFHRSEIASVASELAGLSEVTRAHPGRFTQGR